MSLIRELYKPKVAMLPIGGRFTMDVSQALIAVRLLQPQFVIPMHYNTFDVIRADVGKFQRMVEDQTDTEVVLMEPGRFHRRLNVARRQVTKESPSRHCRKQVLPSGPKATLLGVPWRLTSFSYCSRGYSFYKAFKDG